MQEWEEWEGEGEQVAITFVGRSDVNLQYTVIGRSVRAVRTAERFAACVNPQMKYHGTFTLGLASTYFTLVPHTTRHTHNASVGIEALRRFEPLPTTSTG